ncbi:MAG: cobalamin-dependent protein [Deferrisomatales bacterium]|nr:cobalamin-dependent protein [Deferrisomatales bacterium]
MITKIGFDGHDRGSRIVASQLRDAGMEVIYTPPWQTLDAVVRIAMQEDVDVIGVSSLATDHLLLPELMQALQEAGMGAVQVFAGGIIPEQERPGLTSAGVRAVFGPGSCRQEIVDCALRLGRAAQERKNPS